MERNDVLIKRKMYSYMLPSIMMMAALQLGNIVDAVIVGNLIGSYANTAVNVAVPVIFILQLPNILFGAGGAISAAFCLGKRDLRSANGVYTFALIMTVIFSALFGAIAAITSSPVSEILSGGGELCEMVNTIIRVYSFGMPVACFFIGVSSFIGLDNNPGLSAGFYISANIINLISDYLLIKFTPIGIAGSALSTVLGYVLSGIVVFIMYLRAKNRMLKFNIRTMRETDKMILLRSVKNGIPRVMMTLMNAVSTALLNSGIVNALGQANVAVYSIVNNSGLIIRLCLDGIVNIISTIAGVLYGEKDYFGMRHLVKRIVKICLSVSVVITALYLIFPQAVSGAFGFNITELEETFEQCVRIFCISFVFTALNSAIQSYYRTIQRTTLATANTVLELFALKVPLAYLFMNFWGVHGVFIAIIFSEILTLLIISGARIILQRAGKLPQKGFMTIPEKNENSYCDVTVEGSDENAVKLSEKLIGYCDDIGIARTASSRIGIAAEELVANIGRYGFTDPKNRYIDVSLTGDSEKLLLRVRDDGIPFNPLEYKSEDKDGSGNMGGIELIKRIASKFTYTRVLNMNNTVVEIELDSLDEEDTAG